jgi:Histidine kinase-, DNA gyrase B-, and HSP90-like ATPase
METHTIQGSLYAEDYLRRTVRSIAHDPLMALTELVANGWDAGAHRVDIRLPEHAFDTLVVEDDGIGMTRDQFIERWMTLGYDRKKHQSGSVEFPPGRQGRRRAFGRNGLGRHALLCFADEYVVETKSDGQGWRFTVRTMSGEDPFGLVCQVPLDVQGHGTRLEVSVERNLVSPDEVIDILAARFLHDPTFEVRVNGNTVGLTDLAGFLESHDLEVDGIHLNVSCIDSSSSARRMAYHGIAFWVGGRLVEEPSWQIGRETILDGRTAHAKRFTIVVRCDDGEIFDHIHPDWSDFGNTSLVRSMQQKVAEFANDFLRRSLANRIEETKESVLRDHRNELEQLDPLGQVEVAEFLDQVTHSMPRVSADTLEVATTAFIKLAQSHSGKALLVKKSLSWVLRTLTRSTLF